MGHGNPRPCGKIGLNTGVAGMVGTEATVVRAAEGASAADRPRLPNASGETPVGPRGVGESCGGLVVALGAGPETSGTRSTAAGSTRPSTAGRR